MLKSCQKGVTMVEALAAIAFASVLLVSVVKLVGNMFDMFKQNLIVNEVQEVQKNITSRYRLEGNYAGLSELSAEDFAKQKLIPSHMFVSDKLMHRLNGEVKIEVSDLGDDYFNIEFDGLTNRTCLNLSQINWNNSLSTDLYQIQINDDVYLLPIPANGVVLGDDNALPINVAKAIKSCKNNDNVIIWTFQ